MSSSEKTTGQPRARGLHAEVLARIREPGTLGLRGLQGHFAVVRASPEPWREMQSATGRWATAVDAICTQAAAEAGVDRLSLLRSLLVSGSPEEVRFLALAVQFGAFEAEPDGAACRAAVKAARARRASAVEAPMENALRALAAGNGWKSGHPGSKPSPRRVRSLLESPSDLLALALDLAPPSDSMGLVRHLLTMRERGLFRARATAVSPAPSDGESSARVASLAPLLAGWIRRHPACRLALADLERLGLDAGSLFQQASPEDLLTPASAVAVSQALALRRSGADGLHAVFVAATSAESSFTERVAAWETIAEILALVETVRCVAWPIEAWMCDLALPSRLHPDPAPESVRRSLAGRRGPVVAAFRGLAEPLGARWNLLRGLPHRAHWAEAVHDGDAIAAFKRSPDARERRRIARSVPHLRQDLAKSIERCTGFTKADLGLLMGLSKESVGDAALRAIASDPALRDAALASRGSLAWLNRMSELHEEQADPIINAVPTAIWRRWAGSSSGSDAWSLIQESPLAMRRFIDRMLEARDLGPILSLAGSELSSADYERVLRAWHADGAPLKLVSALQQAQGHRQKRPYWLEAASSKAEPAPETIDALLALGLSGPPKGLARLMQAAPARILPAVRRLLGDAATCIVASPHHALAVALDAALGHEGRAALVGAFSGDGAVQRIAKRIPRGSTPVLARRRMEAFVASMPLSRAEAIVLEVACVSSLSEVGFLSKCMRHAMKSVDSAKAGAWFDGFYTTYERPKRRGGTRTITAPDRALKRFQRCLLENAFSRVPQHDAVHGFVRGRGIASNAAAHVGQPLVVNVDVKGFFPSTSWQRVVEASRLLADGRIPRSAALFVADLCCYRGALPTGSPTSPAIANLVLRRVDRALATRCAKIGVRYTRYADDLTFSGDDRAKRIIPFVRSLLAEVGYELDLSKTQLYRRGRQQIVTGLTVNDRVNVKRSDRRRLRAAVHARVSKGSATWHGRPMDDAALLGHLAMLHAVDPAKAAALRERLAPVVARKKRRRRRDG